MAVDKELLQLDLYALLGVGEKASDKEVKKAYRQKALTCHPDKNPDNPRAEELFHQLSQALAVLTDAAARAAYDKVRKAKKQAAERTQKLDERRKKVKLDLEAREREAQAHVSEEEEIRITRTLEQEIIRLREEGSRQLEEQQKLMRDQIRLEREPRVQGKQDGNGVEGKGTPKLKLRWKCKKDDETKGGYSKEVLLQILQKYGEVLNLVISSKKTGSAVVEFATVKAAVSLAEDFRFTLLGSLEVDEGTLTDVAEEDCKRLIMNDTGNSEDGDTCVFTCNQGSEEKCNQSLVCMGIEF